MSADQKRGKSEPRNSECEFAGHLWVQAGGGLQMCARCEDEQWADGGDEMDPACPQCGELDCMEDTHGPK